MKRLLPRWLEPELIVLFFLVVAAHTARLTDLPLRWEETRRARVAHEMIEAADWIVPRQQGEIYLSRPPLQNWLIASAAWVTGEVNLLAARLPSVLATVLTTTLLYLYVRAFLPPLGAFAAGVSFATMAQILEMGRLAETDALLTLFISASLLLWHSGYARGWNPALTWFLGYSCAALGALTKGVQAPLCFVAATWIYLILTKRWAYLMSWSHGAGMLALLAIVAIWQIPFWQRAGWPAVRAIWLQNVALRFGPADPWPVVAHITTYPLEILASMLPWSILLFFYLSKPLRRTLFALDSFQFFLLVCIAVTFPTVWLPSESRTRYFMPLYPCFAALIGAAVQRAYDAPAGSELSRIWRRFLTGMALVILILGTIVLGPSVMSEASSVWAQPIAFAIFYAAGNVALAAFIYFFLRNRLQDLRSWRLGLLAFAGHMALSYNGLFINRLINDDAGTEASVAELKRRLPASSRLVSLGQIHHRFAFYYRDRIEKLPWPGNVAPLAQPDTLFCFLRHAGKHASLPFEWEEVARVPLGSRRRNRGEPEIVIGRLLSRPPN